MLYQNTEKTVSQLIQWKFYSLFIFFDVKQTSAFSFLPLERENTAWKYMNDTKEVLIKGKFYVDRGKPDAMLGKSTIKKWTGTDWIFIRFI